MSNISTSDKVNLLRWAAALSERLRAADIEQTGRLVLSLREIVGEDELLSPEDPLTLLLATTLETASEAIEAHTEALKAVSRLLAAFDEQREPEVLALYRAQGGEMAGLPVEDVEGEM